MTTRILSLAAALLLSVSSAAMAVEPSAVAGDWLYDTAGKTIGSVIGSENGGASAKIMVGSYLRQGSHTAVVPAGSLSVVNGKVVLQQKTVEALNIKK